MLWAVVYDPWFATPPKSILAASAMNGFNKGIETLYARNATPVTDATALRELRFLQEGLHQLSERDVDEAALDPVVEGILEAKEEFNGTLRNSKRPWRCVE